MFAKGLASRGWAPREEVSRGAGARGVCGPRAKSVVAAPACASLLTKWKGVADGERPREREKAAAPHLMYL